jgi:hypothetical protein
MNFNPHQAWEEYKTLETELIRYIRYVPLIEPHYQVWSFYLGNLLNNIGSIIDSFCKNAIYSPSLSAFEGIEEYRNPDRHNMGAYRIVFEKFYELSNKHIYDHQNLTPIIPYSNWKQDKAADWWINDRFQNKERATLKTTLDALGALFLLNVIHLDTIPHLVDIDVIQTMGVPKSTAKKILGDGQPIVEPHLLQSFYAKTDLFGYVYLNKNIRITADEEKGLLSPANSGYWRSWE